MSLQARPFSSFVWGEFYPNEFISGEKDSPQESEKNNFKDLKRISLFVCAAPRPDSSPRLDQNKRQHNFLHNFTIINGGASVCPLSFSIDAYLIHCACCGEPTGVQ